MTPEELAGALDAAVAACLEGGEPTGRAEGPLPVTVERPRRSEHGHYTTSAALRLAVALGRPSREIAERVAAPLRAATGIAGVDVAGPGFLNITVAPGRLGATARRIVESGAAYGRSDRLAGQRIELRLVSTDPTQPVHGAKVRCAARVDTLHRLLEASGAQVVVEHHVDDAGPHVAAFGAALHAAGLHAAAQHAAAPAAEAISDAQITEAETPPAGPDAYAGQHGDYLREVAAQVLRHRPGVLDLPEAEARAVFATAGLPLMVRGLQDSLDRFRVGLDTWLPAGDPRRSAGPALTLVRDGRPVRMPGGDDLVTLDDVLDLVGVDAARYSLARHPGDAPLTLDVGEISKHSTDNPVYYVQYAHARTCNTRRYAADVGIELAVFVPELLTDPLDAALLAALVEFPRVVATGAEQRAPHRVARHLEELAGCYHRWYDTCRIVPKGDEPITDANRTRAWVNEATRVVLANGLDLLGVRAPERM